MLITLNNNPEELPGDSMTIREVLTIKRFTFPNLVVRINGQLVKKPDYHLAKIRHGDRLEIIHMISGG